MKKILLVILVVSFLPAFALARKTTYIVTDHRFNHVKLSEVKPRVAEARAMTHPKEIDEGRMRAILKSIKMSRKHLVSKDVDTQDVYNDSSINYLAPALVRAFREAGPMDEVDFSYLVKNPYFIIRNDRLNLTAAWVHENELHIIFYKLYAKVTGDIDKQGNFAKAVSDSRGLRINLEYGPGQQAGIDNPDELVVDLAHNFEGDVAAAAAQAPVQEPAKNAKKKKEAVKAEEAAKTGEAVQPVQTVEERLARLEQLKKDKVITNKEYKEKKKEILKDL